MNFILLKVNEGIYTLVPGEKCRFDKSRGIYTFNNQEYHLDSISDTDSDIGFDKYLGAKFNNWHVVHSMALHNVHNSIVVLYGTYKSREIFLAFVHNIPLGTVNELSESFEESVVLNYDQIFNYGLVNKDIYGIDLQSKLVDHKDPSVKLKMLLTIMIFDNMKHYISIIHNNNSDPRIYRYDFHNNIGEMYYSSHEKFVEHNQLLSDKEEELARVERILMNKEEKLRKLEEMLNKKSKVLDMREQRLKSAEAKGDPSYLFDEENTQHESEQYEDELLVKEEVIDKSVTSKLSSLILSSYVNPKSSAEPEPSAPYTMVHCTRFMR